MSHPYKGLPDFQFWRRAVSAVEPHALDPVVAPRFRIAPGDRLATAGSCFAQHISRRLSAIGFNYFVPEAGEDLDTAERKRRGFGMFSARFGNIYTVRQLLQLFLEAMGERRVSEAPWLREDGRYIDPLRPNIEPDGFAQPEMVVEARRAHIAQVRRMFLEADIFVFTLGLTEGWQNLASGEVFPLAPGVAGGFYDPSRHGPINFNVAQVIEDLTTFLKALKAVNPGVKVLLTVSPVPLIATFEPRHVLVSTTYSKSVLRVAAESAIQAFEWVDYFPSFEIITGGFSLGRYYEEDLREINRAGVSHAMRCFLQNYAEGYAEQQVAPQVVGLGPRSSAEVVCDEETIEKVSF